MPRPRRRRHHAGATIGGTLDVACGMTAAPRAEVASATHAGRALAVELTVRCRRRRRRNREADALVDQGDENG